MLRVEVHRNRFPEAIRSIPARRHEVLQAAAFAIQAHAKNIVPVRTGTLKASIQVWPEGHNRYAVGTTVVYAPYVEFGTRYMAARPYLRPAAQMVADRLGNLASIAFREWP